MSRAEIVAYVTTEPDGTVLRLISRYYLDEAMAVHLLVVTEPEWPIPRTVAMAHAHRDGLKVLALDGAGDALLHIPQGLLDHATEFRTIPAGELRSRVVNSEWLNDTILKETGGGRVYH